MLGVPLHSCFVSIVRIIHLVYFCDGVRKTSYSSPIQDMGWSEWLVVLEVR